MRSSLFFNIVFIVILSLLSYQVTAKQHALSSILSYNLSETDTPAYGLFYHYTFYEEIEIELGLLQKSNVELNENGSLQFAQYDSVFIGTNFIRQYSKDTQLKMGGGVSYISASSNDLLVEEKSYSPYVKFAVNMSLSKNVSIELGQMTQFIIGELELSHNLFLGFTWKFGHTTIKTQKIEQPSNIIVAPAVKPILPSSVQKEATQQALSKVIKDDIAKTTLLENDIELPLEQAALSHWAIQLAAFEDDNRAVKQRAIMATQLLSTDETILRIVDHKGLYKILSPTFTSRQQAIDWLKEAKYAYQWQGFPVFFAN